MADRGLLRTGRERRAVLYRCHEEVESLGSGVRLEFEFRLHHQPSV